MAVFVFFSRCASKVIDIEAVAAIYLSIRACKKESCVRQVIVYPALVYRSREVIGLKRVARETVIFVVAVFITRPSARRVCSIVVISHGIQIITHGRSICVGHYVECEIFNRRVCKEVSKRRHGDKQSGVARRIGRRLRTQCFIPGCVVCRPFNLTAAAAKTSLPVVLFQTDGEDASRYERFITEIASYGYVVIADGAYRYSDDKVKLLQRAGQGALTDAWDNMKVLSETEGSIFHGKVKMSGTALVGRTFPAGLPDGAEIRTAVCLGTSVPSTGVPVLYVTGGEEDPASAAAFADLERGAEVFKACASFPAGPSGTYEESYGGAYSMIVLQWLEWQLKGKSWSRKIFTGEECICMYSGWEIRYKNENSVIQ